MTMDIIGLFPGLERDLDAFYSTGVLPSQSIEELISSGSISAKDKILPDQIQPASIDLRLGSVGYRVQASFLPGENSKVMTRIEKLGMHRIDLSRPAVLESDCVYFIPLMEELSLSADISGKANPKSTTGRLDIFTRLLTDYGSEFERVIPGYRGKLYAEVVPRTFSVLVHEGTKLNQLRFIRRETQTSDAMLRKLDKKETLSYLEDDVPIDAVIFRKSLWTSINLQGSEGSDLIGYKAKHNTPLIDLNKVNHYDPMEFWEAIRIPKS